MSIIAVNGCEYVIVAQEKLWFGDPSRRYKLHLLVKMFPWNQRASGGKCFAVSCTLSLLYLPDATSTPTLSRPSKMPPSIATCPLVREGRSPLVENHCCDVSITQRKALPFYGTVLPLVRKNGPKWSMVMQHCTFWLWDSVLFFFFFPILFWHF